MEKIINIAAQVRQEIELWVSQKHEDFINFDIDQNNLAGACGISSWMLNKILKKNKIHSELVVGWYFSLDNSAPTGHSWVEIIKENKIVDITATQFGIEDKVYIVSPKHRRYSFSKRGKSAEFFIAEYWGSQSPRTYKEELKAIYEKISKNVN